MTTTPSPDKSFSSTERQSDRYVRGADFPFSYLRSTTSKSYRVMMFLHRLLWVRYALARNNTFSRHRTCPTRYLPSSKNDSNLYSSVFVVRFYFDVKSSEYTHGCVCMYTHTHTLTRLYFYSIFTPYYCCAKRIKLLLL